MDDERCWLSLLKDEKTGKRFDGKVIKSLILLLLFPPCGDILHACDEVCGKKRARDVTEIHYEVIGAL